MRLINTSTFRFEEFIGKDIPRYAILSHTWEDEEVTLKHMMMGDLSFTEKKGYLKIKMTCQKASWAGYSHAWIDTCCIDKSSSAELTEAINSMFQWYQRAEVCYVFLSDLKVSAPLETSLRHCRWFTRGWTLQELIAPRDVLFFDQDWKYRGSKADLVLELSKITQIDPVILCESRNLSTTSVAQRMSWAARRETTRVEDMAYCLLGIFDVNMPLLYGEEGKAFRRLQEEIIKSSADLSIFAWRWLPATKSRSMSTDRVFCGILAESPLHFSESGSFAKLPRHDSRDYSVSNSGVKTQAQILSLPIPKRRATSYVLPLNCSWDPKISVGVRLRKCGPDQFVREDPWTLVEYSKPLWPNAPKVRYLLTELPEESSAQSNTDMSLLIGQTRSHALLIERPSELGIYDAWPWARFDDEDQVFFVTADENLDSVAVRLFASFTAVIDAQQRRVEFDAVFFAVGWRSDDISRVQCTVVEYLQLSEALTEVQSQISAWDHNSYQVVETLAHHKIPKKAGALFAILGTDNTVMLSYIPTLVEDPKICRNNFWQIKFTCTILQAGKVPRIRSGIWAQERY